MAPMALKPLTNAGWGFETNCFVCEPSNPLGLRVQYFHDEEAEVVSAEFTLGVEHSGAPHYVHGGVLLAILDEAMAWAAIAIGGRFAVVQSTATTFDRPVRIDEPHRVAGAGPDQDVPRRPAVDADRPRPGPWPPARGACLVGRRTAPLRPSRPDGGLHLG